MFQAWALGFSPLPQSRFVIPCPEISRAKAKKDLEQKEDRLAQKETNRNFIGENGGICCSQQDQDGVPIDTTTR